MAKFDINKVVVPAAKPLPVILLLDVSGSMRGEKIAALNKSVEEMIASFADQTKREVEIQVSAITFGSEVKVHLPYTPAPDIKWTPLSADGATVGRCSGYGERDGRGQGDDAFAGLPSCGCVGI